MDKEEQIGTSSLSLSHTLSLCACVCDRDSVCVNERERAFVCKYMFAIEREKVRESYIKRSSSVENLLWRSK